jgi:ABC-type polysaccharide/polyol phosphate transport system ATPase subunit
VRPLSESPAAVTVRDAHKTFTRPREASHTLKERVLHPLRSRATDRFDALRGVTFDVRRGEFFGVVGRNGSGKSTLLKCMAGIYRLTGGGIWIDGRLSTFIELGVGFNPDLAARDNVVLNGIMLGLTPREARRRYEQVIDFAELRDYEELKLKNYSSGMHVRLAFSVAIQVDADVLLVDEVLAVGDAAFQQKCFDVFYEMRDAGRTILFVTHDMGAVTRFCHRALLLERGEILAIGDPGEVAGRYLQINFPGEEKVERDERGHSAHLVDAWVEDDQGARTGSCLQGRSYTFKAAFELQRTVQDAAFTMVFFDEQGQDVFVATTAFDQDRPGGFSSGERVTFAVTFECVFRPGRYKPAAIMAVGPEVIDRWDAALSFVVVGPYATGGLVDVPHRIELERQTRPLEVR